MIISYLHRIRHFYLTNYWDGRLLLRKWEYTVSYGTVRERERVGLLAASAFPFTSPLLSTSKKNDLRCLSSLLFSPRAPGAAPLADRTTKKSVGGERRCVRINYTRRRRTAL